jgi:hypothetical protein
MSRAGVTSRVTAGGLQHDLVKRPVKRVSATLDCAVAVRSATMRATDLSGLGIYLLGKPRVERDGEAVSNPRGYKAWGLLAYLLRTDRAPSRDELVSLLFSEADDPFAALRWNLSALRHLLGDAGLEGDPLRLSLPRGAFVDVETLISGSWLDALRLPGIERELLEGMSFSSSRPSTFGCWRSVAISARRPRPCFARRRSRGSGRATLARRRISPRASFG